MLDAEEVSRWFDQYIEAFYGCVRASSYDFRVLLEFYHVPLYFTTDVGLIEVGQEGDLLDGLGPEADRLRAAGYARTDVLSQEFAPLNHSSGLCSYAFVLRRGDGTEIESVKAPYLIVRAPQGLRILSVAMQPVQ
jgi:hypothetical protein